MAVLGFGHDWDSFCVTLDWGPPPLPAGGLWPGLKRHVDGQFDFGQFGVDALWTHEWGEGGSNRNVGGPEEGGLSQGGRRRECSQGGPGMAVQKIGGPEGPRMNKRKSPHPLATSKHTRTHQKTTEMLAFFCSK